MCGGKLRLFSFAGCSDKDCLEDLRVYFTQDKNDLIANATNVRLRSVDVITVYLDLESVPFNKGFYSVDMTFFFDVCLDIFSAASSTSVVVSGIAVFNKKVILYGGEGNVKSFSSDNRCDALDPVCSRVLPKATVQVAQPVALAAYLKDCCTPLRGVLPYSGWDLPPLRRHVRLQPAAAAFISRSVCLQLCRLSAMCRC